MNYAIEITRSLQTIQEMLTDRGLDASVLSQYTVDEVSNMGTIFAIDIPKEQIKIIFDMSQKTKWVDVKKECNIENDAIDIKLLIYVTRDKINTSETKKIDELRFDYQVFDMKDLQFNISKHMLVPKHTLINDPDEINKILEAYQVKLNQLPQILKCDKMAQYLNAKVGNLVKITRISPTSGEHIVYRCVVHNPKP